MKSSNPATLIGLRQLRLIPRRQALVLDLRRQLADPASPLRRGKVTCRATALHVVTSSPMPTPPTTAQVETAPKRFFSYSLLPRASEILHPFARLGGGRSLQVQHPSAAFLPAQYAPTAAVIGGGGPTDFAAELDGILAANRFSSAAAPAPPPAFLPPAATAPAVSVAPAGLAGSKAANGVGR